MSARVTFRGGISARNQGQDDVEEMPYNVPDAYINLDEVATSRPTERSDTGSQHATLEDVRSRDQQLGSTALALGYSHREKRNEGAGTEHQQLPGRSESATQLYTVSYLVFFAILGTLARLGLQALTFYPGAPIAFGVLWANFAGSLFMGFLSEDRKLFKQEWGIPLYHQQLEKAKLRNQDEENGTAINDESIDLVAAKKAYLATKKAIPLFIGLATGFCGSLTSFSSFMRDVFHALTNDLPVPNSSTASRNGGFSFMALVAVLITTVTVCLSGLHFGAHLAIFLEPWTPSLPYAFMRKFLDRVVVLLAWGSWLGSILLAIWPPDRHTGDPEIWRGRAVFAIVFAPLGCLGRFYASLYLNKKIPSFPLGTFVVNILGTAILGMCWDLQHVPVGGVVGCQVLQGIQDGFCGCLTTVSTWVSELSSLRRRSHAYRYGVASIATGLGFLVVIMGSLRWTQGFSEILCVH